MSIIRQRSKNLLVSGAIGFLVALTVILLVYMFGVRGNITVIEWLLKDSQLEVTTKKEPIEPEIEEKQKVFTVTQRVEKDSVISRNQIQSIEVASHLVPSSACTDITDVLGKKALLDIDPLMMLTATMIRDVDIYELPFETIEIRELRIPEILAVGDQINLRIHFPTGQDYTVVQTKEVIHIDTEMQSFFIEMNEEEILSYSSAREDVHLYPGTEVYVTKENQGFVRNDMAEDVMNIGQLLRDGLDYELYPLNPNALALSLINKYQVELLDARVVLDESLTQFFDENSLRFTYEVSTYIELEGEEENIPLSSGEEVNEITGAQSNKNKDATSDTKPTATTTTTTKTGTTEATTSEGKESISTSEKEEYEETTKAEFNF